MATSSSRRPGSAACAAANSSLVATTSSVSDRLTSGIEAARRADSASAWVRIANSSRTSCSTRRRADAGSPPSSVRSSTAPAISSRMAQVAPATAMRTSVRVNPVSLLHCEPTSRVLPLDAQTNPEARVSRGRRELAGDAGAGHGGFSVQAAACGAARRRRVPGGARRRCGARVVVGADLERVPGHGSWLTAVASRHARDVPAVARDDGGGRVAVRVSDQGWNGWRAGGRRPVGGANRGAPAAIRNRGARGPVLHRALRRTRPGAVPALRETRARAHGGVPGDRPRVPRAVWS